MKHLDLVGGKLLPTLLRFTIPILLAILLQTAYGTVDLLIVGRFSTIGDLSAVTIGSQIMQAITAFCTGLAMGTTILIGKYMASGQRERTSEVVGVSVIIFSVLAMGIMGILLLFHVQIGEVMNTPKEAVAQTHAYLIISGVGTLFIVYYNLLASIFRGIGDSKTPLKAVFVACVLNISLDLVFVGGFQWGAKGAALATVLAQGLSVGISLYLLRKRELPFDFGKKYLKYLPDVGGSVLKLGIPVAMQGVLVSISFLAITAIVNEGFGVSASAAVGIVEKITGIILVVPIAFMQSLSAFVAQNLGANQSVRAKQGLFYSIFLSLGFGVCTSYLCYFHGTILTDFFVKDNEETTLAALSYLKSYAFDCVFVAIMFSFSGYFNGCGKTTFVMTQAVFGAICIRIPLAMILSGVPDTSLFLIGMATPSSTFVQIFLCLGYYFHEKKKESCVLEKD